MSLKILLVVSGIMLSLNVMGQGDQIKLNSLGFLPDGVKKASIISPCRDFVIKNEKHEVVFSDKVSDPIEQDDVNRQVWIADFSDFKTKGTYYLDVPNVGRSIHFKIDEGVYVFPYMTAMRAFYLWRCGVAVEGKHKGQIFSHGLCHMDDGYLDYIGTPGERYDGIGGWHDAGDYGKYVVNAGVTVGVLFLTWDHFEDQLKTISLNLPETAPGYPDFLKEIKWEIDWILKMQYPDGSGKVSHKLTRKNFSAFIMPENDEEKRYFTDWSSTAVADSAAMLAMAARYFKPYDAAYARRCLNTAVQNYTVLRENLQNKRADLSDFKTGGYGTRDSDDRLWAFSELWETTGDDKYLKDFEMLVKAPAYRRRSSSSENKIDENWDWGNVRNLGMFTYVLSDRPGRDPELLAQVRKDVIATADALVAKGQKDVYGRPLVGIYYWGCNGTVARQAVNLHVADLLSPDPAYHNTTISILDHLFGRNDYGRSYVTGLGYKPPLHPHCRRSGADNVDNPWPGYLVGGGETATDWNDEQADYRTNEIAINWQAALVYALAGCVQSSPN